MNKELKEKIRKRLISDYGNMFSKPSIEKDELRKTVMLVLNGFSSRERFNLSVSDKELIIDELLDEFLGFGPLESMLRDPSITEIMINGPKKVYAERAGKKELTDVTFENEDQLMYIIRKILQPTRRRVDESFPYADVSLKDGSRVNIIIPPLALDGPVVTIRKFLKEIKKIENLINLGTLDKRMGDFLVASIKAKLNILFAGATGSGKTTTVGVLSDYIPKDERIITIEDTAELHLNQEHVVRLETKLPNIEGKGEITIRDLFKNSLRMRPQRIILGEIRGAEALDMLQSMCSGHAGSLAVLHASSPREVISRLETMILTSGLPITLEAIHRQIAAAINLIVQQEQLKDGSRKITHITQVTGLKGNEILLEDIFLYEMEDFGPDGRIKGRWRATGSIPVFSSQFKKAGINLPEELFKRN